MLFPAPLPFAGILGVSEILTFFIPVAGIILAGVIATTAMYFSNQQKRQWHETARLALEKGQPVPTSALGNRLSSAQNDRNDIRTGLILIAVGVGLYIFFQGVGARPVAQIGAVPGCIGVALLLYGLLTPKKSIVSDRPPQS